ncbi:MAG: mRNA surveillance protein pelota [Candidatus Heimdallarchaeota archaeon]|nr:MAG: mRNA surveillance protein pelota [Candidatus Heimdallarchaeota archaeon]
MRVLKKDMKNNRVVLRPESATDLYILSNVISIGDRVITKTNRRVRRSGSEGRSGDDSQRITMVIGIEAEDYAFQDSSVSNRLRVKGKIFQGPEQYVSIGSYHTLNLELTSVITIIKAEWSKYFLELLKKAEEASKKPKICLIAADKAEICIGILDNFNLNVLAHEKSHISRKLSKEKVRSKQTQSFFDRIAMIISRQVLSETKKFVIGGPGFIKEQLTTFLKNKFTKEGITIIVAGSLSGGNRVGLSELLQMEAVDKLAADFQIFEENSLFDEFFKRLNQGSTNVTYGFVEIKKIVSTGAIETLILLDSLLKGGSGINPDEVQHLLREVEKTRGKIVIISSHSENANQIKTFGGIIGLLRYALHWD